MRTSIDLSDAQAEALRVLASSRGGEPLERLLAEAVAQYLDRQADYMADFNRLMSLGSAFSDGRAEELQAHVRELRSNWSVHDDSGQ